MPRCANKKFKSTQSPIDPPPKDPVPRDSPLRDLTSRDPPMDRPLCDPPMDPPVRDPPSQATTNQPQMARNEQFILHGKDQNDFVKELKFQVKRFLM